VIPCGAHGPLRVQRGGTDARRTDRPAGADRPYHDHAALAYVEARLPPRRTVDGRSILARLRPQRDEAIEAGRWAGDGGAAPTLRYRASALDLQ
jgi:hypothetical protein